MAVVHGNRTRPERLSAPHTGFEDRAGHQIRAHYRRGGYAERPVAATPMIAVAAPPKEKRERRPSGGGETRSSTVPADFLPTPEALERKGATRGRRGGVLRRRLPFAVGN